MSAVSFRWPVPSLGKDETLQSLVERAALFFECTPERLWAATHHDYPSAGEPDAPSVQALARVARAIDRRPSDLLAARVPGTPAWLHPAGRHAYCPYCWEADLKAGVPCTYRRHWARTLSVSCPEHQAPLLLWRLRDRKDEVSWEAEVAVALMALESLSTDPAFIEASAAVHRFASDLDAALFHGKPAPRSWNGSPRQIRCLMERMLTDNEL